MDLDIAAFLREVEIFQKLTAEDAERLAADATEHVFEAGAKMVRRGEPGDCMFVLIDGQARVPVFGEKGEQLFVAQLVSGDVFGEMALLTGVPRSADVEAVTACRCLVFYRAAIEELIAKHPGVAQLLTTLLGERLLSSGAIRQVGKYRIFGELGRGSMSIVYEGLHPELQRPVAIKMLSHTKVYNPRFQRQFENEAKIVGRLRHPHIVEVFDTERAYRTLFIIMERLQGLSLDRLIEAGGPLSPTRAREVLRQLASALALAHAHGIVHRDLKPSNIMIRDNVVKLMDFGLALDSQGSFDEGPDTPVAGTPRYMAPEQIRGEPVDRRADIYSLGLVGYVLLTGRAPFTGSLSEVLMHHQSTPVPSPRKWNAEIPEDLETFVVCAAAKSPMDRFQNCEEILAHLDAPPDIDSSRFAVRTLTMLYDRSQKAAVDDLVERARARADTLHGIDLRVSGE